MHTVVNKFIRYAKIFTESDPYSETVPSTQRQFDLAHILVAELKELGLTDAAVDSRGYIQATLPTNTNKKAPVIGFLAHMDTAPDLSGENVNPQFVENYNGGDITLNAKNKIVLSPNDFPVLKNYVGQTLITTDGTTLLGADDKAGIAEIMAALEFLNENPSVEHGTVKIGFTPDEEIGRGADHFNVESFGADWAYTLDGGEIGELEYENFNAAGAKIHIQGRNVHPGTAKDQMINSIQLAKELDDMLPAVQRPEHTEGYEGFFHLMSFKGEIEETEVMYIVRDHNRAKFEKKKSLLSHAVGFMNKKYGEGTITLEMTDQYYNMREKVEPVMHIVDLAHKAMLTVGVSPIVKAIRGGTDGSRLSFMGLPTPNIFTGGHNFHGRYEFIPVQSMEKAVAVIIKIMELSIDND